jgi:hypothetical protein
MVKIAEDTNNKLQWEKKMKLVNCFIDGRRSHSVQHDVYFVVADNH